MIKRKSFLGIMAILILSAITITITLAWFTDREEVYNVFTVGKVDITLTEPKWDEKMEEDVNHSLMMPGKTILKDPTVTVDESSQPSYVRVKITVPTRLKNIIEDFDLNDGWVYKKTVSNDYYYEYTGIVNPNTTLPPVFDEVVVKTTASSADFASIEEEDLNIDIVAEAIQAANLENQAAAWAAFDGGGI